MNKKNEEFQKRLLATFKIEAEEHVKAITSGLIELEKDLTPETGMEVIERTFREVHSLKGAARSVSAANIESLCQATENVFSALKHKEIDLHPALFNTLHRVVDAFNEMIFSSDMGVGFKGERIAAIKEHLSRMEAGELTELQASAGESGESFPAGTYLPAEVVRVPTEKMVALLLQAEEMVSAKLAVSQQLEDIAAILAMIEEWNRKWSKKYPEIQDLRRIKERKIRSENNRTNPAMPDAGLLEFLDMTRARIRSIEKKVVDLKRQTQQNRYSIGIMTENLLEDSKKALMLPFAALFDSFPKVIRDLSHEHGKEVKLTVSGEEAEVDRRILEELRIPFIHLIRNSIDHGIEKPDRRVEVKKPKAGKIGIAVSLVEGNKAEITFSDDGAGVDIEKVKEVSLNRGIAQASGNDQPTDQEMLSLIFQSGFSTSPIITDISGRGLGLAIVKEKIEKLNGRISIESRQNQGTTFKIAIPLSLITFRGVLVKAVEQAFVIPTPNIERVIRISKEKIKTIENRETIPLEDITVPLARLGDILELPGIQEDRPFLHTVVVESAGKMIGIVVDEILSEQEVVVKNFNRHLSRIRNIAGATILGSGKVAPILNVQDLIKSAMKYHGAPLKVDGSKTKEEKRSILVVEDSITSRMLLKGILETSGYNVKTAVDGIDAITCLKTDKFDVVVSDVDMPRMNGFDLTAKIRSDKQISNLPVVLVTALESREDKERGIDVGASAYIVKSSFDQSNLLEVIKRLI